LHVEKVVMEETFTYQIEGNVKGYQGKCQDCNFMQREREREMACSVSALFFVELLFVIVHAMHMQSGCGVQSGTGVW
jgi:hypothetical protein